MPLTVFTRRNFVADFLAISDGKQPFCVFEPPLGGDLETTYDVHLRKIGKRVVDFLLVLIELFCCMLPLRRYTSEHRLKIGDFAPTGLA